jgi:hypothetical protein
MRVKHITGRLDDDIYMSRYWLLGRKTSRWALMLHKMHRPDDDACHHDHPWSFWTVILKGGYLEQVTMPDGTVKMRHNRPGMILYRKAEHTHRIHSLPKGSCWTLVWRFKKRRSWGFLTRVGWVGWMEFIEKRLGKGVLWCGTDDRETD